MGFGETLYRYSGACRHVGEQLSLKNMIQKIAVCVCNFVSIISKSWDKGLHPIVRTQSPLVQNKEVAVMAWLHHQANRIHAIRNYRLDYTNDTTKEVWTLSNYLSFLCYFNCCAQRADKTPCRSTSQMLRRNYGRNLANGQEIIIGNHRCIRTNPYQNYKRNIATASLINHAFPVIISVSAWNVAFQSAVSTVQYTAPRVHRQTGTVYKAVKVRLNVIATNYGSTGGRRTYCNNHHSNVSLQKLYPIEYETTHRPTPPLSCHTDSRTESKQLSNVSSQFRFLFFHRQFTHGDLERSPVSPSPPSSTRSTPVTRISTSTTNLAANDSDLCRCP